MATTVLRGEKTRCALILGDDASRLAPMGSTLVLGLGDLRSHLRELVERVSALSWAAP